MDSSKILWGVKKASAITKIYIDAKNASIKNPHASLAIFIQAMRNAEIVAQTPQFYDATIKSTAVKLAIN